MSTVEELLEEHDLKITDFHNINTLVDAMVEFTDDIDSKKIDLGFPLLHAELRGLRVQELLTVIAGAGVGKSALNLNFMLNYAKATGELTILFSLEMSKVGIGERIFQIELDKYGYEVEKNFVANDEVFINQCRGLHSSLKNFILVTKRIDVHQIPVYVKIIEVMMGKKARLVGVDYIGLMGNHLFPKDEYARTTDNMIKIYSYAKELDVGILNLSQTSRADIKYGEALTIHSGKSSGEVENSSDFVITLEVVLDDTRSVDEQGILSWLETYCTAKNEALDLMRMTTQKNRREKKQIIYVILNRKNLRMTEYCRGDYSLTKPTGEYEENELEF